MYNKSKSITFIIINFVFCVDSEQWTCTMCMRDDGLVIEKPVEKDFEITSTGKRKAPSGLTDRELKVSNTGTHILLVFV